MDQNPTDTAPAVEPPQYPEHDKQAKVLDEASTIGEFLEWLTGEHRIVLARYIETQGWAGPDSKLCPASDSIEKLLAAYFDIDLARIQAEKDAMLASARQEARS